MRQTLDDARIRHWQTLNYFLVFVFDASDFAVLIPVSVKRTALQLHPSKIWTRARCWRFDTDRLMLAETAP